jgi:undecaprenyl-diphosphatase
MEALLADLGRPNPHRRLRQDRGAALHAAPGRRTRTSPVDGRFLLQRHVGRSELNSRNGLYDSAVQKPKYAPRCWRLLKPAALLLVLLLSLAVGMFFWTADEMREGETLMRDRQWLLALRMAADPAQLLGGPATLQLTREINALGSPWFLMLLVGGSAGVLAAARFWRMALFLVVTTVAGALVDTALKGIFDRARPDLVPHEVMVTNASFPSGHAFGAAMTYLTMAALLSRLIRQPVARVLLMFLAVGVAVAVGVCRVALGVHWPSDVLAGWAAGAAWALASWMIADWTGWIGPHGVALPNSIASFDRGDESSR